MKIVMVRHTAVDVPPGTCYGQTDVPLKASFPEEAAQVAERLRAYGRFEHAYTSPLSRCTRLAEYCGFPHAQRDDRLLELNMGEWEMLPFNEIKDPRIAEWFADYLHTPTPGGESLEMQYRRVSHFLEELRGKEGQAVVFAHGGVLVCAQIHAGMVAAEQAFSALPLYGGVVEINL